MIYSTFVAAAYETLPQLNLKEVGQSVEFTVEHGALPYFSQTHFRLTVQESAIGIPILVEMQLSDSGQWIKREAEYENGVIAGIRKMLAQQCAAPEFSD